jgi:hypothetical protein
MGCYLENLRYVQGDIQSGLNKLKAAMHEGPDATVMLTSSEGTTFYLLLTEQLGIKHRKEA